MILETRSLCRDFRLNRGLFQPPRIVRAVQEVTLGIEQETCLGIVGESGSGKSTLGRLLLGLLRPSGGSVHALGRDVNSVSRSDWRQMRRNLALVSQNPRGALDPRRTVGDQVAEPLSIHEPGLDRRAIQEARRAAFDAVGLSAGLLDRYPHQISGGQRQRVVLARALTLRPKVIVMDEPTSALDVSVQVQVMELIGELKARFGLTYVFISHDLRNLRRIADRIGVMYAGRLVEEGRADVVCRSPAHPYTQALLAAVPRLGANPATPRLVGEPPDPAALPSGCSFHPRCPVALPLCAVSDPLPRVSATGQTAACHLVGQSIDEGAAAKEQA